jgi:hypothetical protein
VNCNLIIDEKNGVMLVWRRTFRSWRVDATTFADRHVNRQLGVTPAHQIKKVWYRLTGVSCETSSVLVTWRSQRGPPARMESFRRRSQGRARGSIVSREVPHSGHGLRAVVLLLRCSILPSRLLDFRAGSAGCCSASGSWTLLLKPLD